MAAWIVRGGGRNANYEEGFLKEQSIGIYFGTDTDLTHAAREEIEREVRHFHTRAYDNPNKATDPANVQGTITRFTNQLLLFRDGIEIGDTVIMPRKKSGGKLVAVGRVTSDYEHWDGEIYQHRRRVLWEHESVPRENLPLKWAANNQQTVIKIG